MISLRNGEYTPKARNHQKMIGRGSRETAGGLSRTLQPMWKHYLWLVPVMFTMLWAVQFIPLPRSPDPRLARTVASEFSGIVDFIDQGRGLKIGLRGDSVRYMMSGACNDTACLGEVVQFGDSLSKDKRSIVIRLKSNVTGRESFWYMKDYQK